MTFMQAFEATEPGDKIKHLETQVVLTRTENSMAMRASMSVGLQRATNDDGWIVIKRSETR